MKANLDSNIRTKRDPPVVKDDSTCSTSGLQGMLSVVIADLGLLPAALTY